MVFAFCRSSTLCFFLDTENARNSGHYHALFQLVDPVSTTQVYKNEVLRTYKVDVYFFIWGQ